MIEKLLEQAGFVLAENGEAWVKIIEGEELLDYMSADADMLDRIKAGEISHLYVEIYPEREVATYVPFSHYPTQQDIANINVPTPDDFSGVIEWLQERQGVDYYQKKTTFDWWFAQGGETAYWLIAPDGEHCPPPECEDYGYEAYDPYPESDMPKYWHIRKRQG